MSTTVDPRLRPTEQTTPLRTEPAHVRTLTRRPRHRQCRRRWHHQWLRVRYVALGAAALVRCTGCQATRVVEL